MSTGPSINDEHEAIAAALDCILKRLSVHELEVWASSAREIPDKRASRVSLRSKREEHELRNGVYLVIKESSVENGTGTIEIPYYSPDEKNWLLKALSNEVTQQTTSKGVAKPSAATLR